VIQLLEQHGGLVLFGALCGSFCVIAVAEMFVPRRTLAAGQAHRWLNNLGLTCITTFITRLAVLATGLTTAWWANQQQFGLLPWLDLGWWPSWLILLLVLELGDYVIHRWMHSMHFLWRVHAIHHSDTEFDVTTTYRNHPVAGLYQLVLRLPLVAALGAPVSVMIAFEAVTTAHNLWSHSNTRLPEAIERYLRRVLVTPDFHRIHHCSEKKFTDSNFSSMLPCFDYVFGTYRTRPFANHATMQIGLEKFRDPSENRLDQLLLMPLRVTTDPANATVPNTG
jgi:sterol desaturase/sphingolipid hydroxylase (fatty acid hydroxylase superfamily)